MGLLDYYRQFEAMPVEEVNERLHEQAAERRRKALVDWEGRRVEVSLDAVDRLGTFVELELVVPPAEFEAARACIGSLARRLELTQSERRSYLRLLLNAQQQTEPRP